MSGPNSRQKMLNLNFQTLDDLYLSYMSFIENGGLFVETKGEYRLGDEVFMLVTLPEDKERYPVAGAVVWVTPEGAVGSRKQGIGVQINDQDKGRLRNKIEGLLEGLMESDRPTMTM